MCMVCWCCTNIPYFMMALCYIDGTLLQTLRVMLLLLSANALNNLPKSKILLYGREITNSTMVPL